jgi:hypothetical protein
LIAVLAIAGGSIWWVQHRADEEIARHERETREAAARVRREEQRWVGVRRESAALVPDMLRGVVLGMTTQELLQVRPRAARNRNQAQIEPGLIALEENLANGARVVYAFRQANDRLERIQVLSLLPGMSAIGPHLEAMNVTYGAPTGMWNCPDTGGVPTRRFTWRRTYSTLADIFLVYGDRVSLTLYVAPNNVIQHSLQRASCRPVRSREEAAEFPVASPEQMLGSSPR